MLPQVFHPLRHSIVFSLLSLGIFVAGCTGAQEQPKATGLVTGQFVGDAAPSTAQHTFVTVAASTPEEGQDMREVRAYLCDGQQISEWFKGPVTGNDLDLTSEDGSQLKGSLAAEATSGTITLNDGKALTFEAKPAAGPSGLYNANITSDGSFSGTSENSGRIEGQIAQEANAQGRHALTGIVTSAEGQTFNIESEANDVSPGDARLIVSEDAHAVGAGKRLGSDLGFRITCWLAKMVKSQQV